MRCNEAIKRLATDDCQKYMYKSYQYVHSVDTEEHFLCRGLYSEENLQVFSQTHLPTSTGR